MKLKTLFRQLRESLRFESQHCREAGWTTRHSEIPGVSVAHTGAFKVNIYDESARLVWFPRRWLGDDREAYVHRYFQGSVEPF